MYLGPGLSYFFISARSMLSIECIAIISFGPIPERVSLPLVSLVRLSGISGVIEKLLEKLTPGGGKFKLWHKYSRTSFSYLGCTDTVGGNKLPAVQEDARV